MQNRSYDDLVRTLNALIWYMRGFDYVAADRYDETVASWNAEYGDKSPIMNSRDIDALVKARNAHRD